MKKTLSFLYAPIMLMMVIGISSCKKYDEGPVFSLNSKKARVVNTWKLNKATSNGEDVTSIVGEVVFQFKKDNTLISTFNGNIDNGNWELTLSKESLIIRYSNDTEVWGIAKLKKDEMWIEIDEYGDKLELIFVTK